MHPIWRTHGRFSHRWYIHFIHYMKLVVMGVRNVNRPVRPSEDGDRRKWRQSRANIRGQWNSQVVKLVELFKTLNLPVEYTVNSIH
jgi:hypothetical protein